LPKEERMDLWEEVFLAKRLLTAALKPEGFNIGFNLGSSAGGSIEHLHAHIVPRWTGDNNFMPVVGDTRVLPQSLDATWEKLTGAARPLKTPTKTTHFPTPRHLSQLYADRHENLVHAERAFGVRIVTREEWLKIEAPEAPLAMAQDFFD